MVIRTVAIVVAVVLLLVVWSSAFIVREWEQVIITRFGKPIGNAITEPGLHFRVPFIDQIHPFEKRFLEWDGLVTQVPTKEKRFILVDTYARWRITDPLLFFQRLKNEAGAHRRLDGILNGETRDAVASHNLVELVRTTNREPLQDESLFEGETSELEPIEFGREVIAFLPELLDRPNVLGIGEIGLHKCTANEVTTLLSLVDLALTRGELMLFHTPHLEDKLKGTRMILDVLADDDRVDPGRVCVDHCEEHTIGRVLDEGYWAGITLYPTTKATPERAVDMVEMHGPERLLINSSADWGPSDPLSVPNFIMAMRRRGHDEALIRQVVYDNPVAWMSGSSHFQSE